ncbi:MAG: hydrogen peroxide-inducible genes activator [Betaproteobacteria bacterium]|jgi:LysR family hydrogen peroxide-inducible transcriptional activator
MTLTELRYVVAVAREKHFGRAAGLCFVSQPTLSIAIRKLEEELGVTLFERGPGELGITPIGQRIVEQAQRVIEESAAITEIARQGKDPLNEPLRLGAIYTVAPYLLPHLVKQLHRRAPKLSLLIEENYTRRLLEMLRGAEVDVIVVALPIASSGLTVQPLYDETFQVAVPAGHAWAQRKRVAAADLAREPMLLLGSGHCFRDQVLDACPALNRGGAAPGTLQQTVEGGSLETIRHMVASGVGITVLPSTSINQNDGNGLLRFIPFTRPIPDRRVVMAWRKAYPRVRAIQLLRQSILASPLRGVTFLDLPARDG